MVNCALIWTGPAALVVRPAAVAVIRETSRYLGIGIANAVWLLDADVVIIDGALTEAITSGRAHAWAMPPLYMLAIGSTKARSMSNLRYRYVIGGLVFSRAAWARITSDEQAIVLAVCREREPRIRASWRKETERGIAALHKSGVAIREASDADLAAFAEVTTNSRKAQALDKLGARVVTAIEAR